MKPRLTRGWFPAWTDSYLDLHGWYCTGGGISAWGVDPLHAYGEWLKKPRPGSIIVQEAQQHETSFWQRWFA